MSYLWSEKEAFHSPAASDQRRAENTAALLLRPLSFERAIVVIVYGVHSVRNGGGGIKEHILPQNHTPTHPPSSFGVAFQVDEDPRQFCPRKSVVDPIIEEHEQALHDLHPLGVDAPELMVHIRTGKL